MTSDEVAALGVVYGVLITAVACLMTSDEVAALGVVYGVLVTAVACVAGVALYGHCYEASRADVRATTCGALDGGGYLLLWLGPMLVLLAASVVAYRRQSRTTLHLAFGLLCGLLAVLTAGVLAGE